MESWPCAVGKDGKLIPRQIINKLEALLNGKQIMSATLYPSTSANPYIDFDMKVEEAGEFEFKWFDDNGEVYTKKGENAAGRLTVFGGDGEAL